MASAGFDPSSSDSGPSEPSGPTDEDRARALHEEILALQEQMLSVHRSQRAELSRLAERKDIEAKALGEKIKAKRQAKHTDAAASGREDVETSRRSCM